MTVSTGRPLPNLGKSAKLSPKAIMSDEERSKVIDFIAANPETGVALGGGLRKVRIPRQGSGKSGGYRTIYVFGGTHMPHGRALNAALI